MVRREAMVLRSRLLEERGVSQVWHRMRRCSKEGMLCGLRVARSLGKLSLGSLGHVWLPIQAGGWKGLFALSAISCTVKAPPTVTERWGLSRRKKGRRPSWVTTTRQEVLPCLSHAELAWQCVALDQAKKEGLAARLPLPCLEGLRELRHRLQQSPTAVGSDRR